MAELLESGEWSPEVFYRYLMGVDWQRTLPMKIILTAKSGPGALRAPYLQLPQIPYLQFGADWQRTVQKKSLAWQRTQEGSSLSCLTEVT